MPDIRHIVGPDAPTVTNERGGSQSKVPVRFDLVDGKAIFAMAAVLHEGAEKYGANNWRKIDIEDHLNHLIMHAYAYLSGDRSDEHLSHIMCRAMFAQGVAIDEAQEDDFGRTPTDHTRAVIENRLAMNHTHMCPTPGCMATGHIGDICGTHSTEMISMDGKVYTDPRTDVKHLCLSCKSTWFGPRTDHVACVFCVSRGTVMVVPDKAWEIPQAQKDPNGKKCQCKNCNGTWVVAANAIPKNCLNCGHTTFMVDA